MFKRSPGSGYAGQNTIPTSRQGAITETTYESKTQLRRLESSLQTDKEKQQYSKILPWFKSDEEKIDFLSQPNLNARHEWIQRNSIWARSNKPSSTQKKLMEAGDIGIGMPMDYVKRSWGEPNSVDTSGNPIYKNERWKYTRYVSTPEGYKQEKRYVYFENGQVVGWETDQ